MEFFFCNRLRTAVFIPAVTLTELRPTFFFALSWKGVNPNFSPMVKMFQTIGGAVDRNCAVLPSFRPRVLYYIIMCTR